MADRVRKVDLERMATEINRRLGTPETAHTRGEGWIRPNIGNVHLVKTYDGRWRLEQIANEGGGTRDFLGPGYATKRELREVGQAWLQGFTAGKESG